MPTIRPMGQPVAWIEDDSTRPHTLRRPGVPRDPADAHGAGTHQVAGKIEGGFRRFAQ